MRTLTFGVCVLVLAAGACKKQESENPAPSAAPAAVASPPATMRTAQATEVKPEVPAAEEAQATATATAAEATATVQQASAPKAKALGAPSPSSSAKPSAASTEAAGILKCCSALDAAAAKDGMYKSRYSSASAVCKGLAAQVKSGSANPTSVKTTLRAQLQGVPIPGGC